MKVTVKPDEAPKYSNKYPYFGALRGRSQVVVLFNGPNEGTKIGNLDEVENSDSFMVGIGNYSRHWAESDFDRLPSGTISWSDS